MKILVVGGAGFIGHNVVRMLQQEGHDVTIFDSCTTYGILSIAEQKELVNERLATLKEDTELIRGDISSKATLERAFNDVNPDVVIHLASFPRAKIVNTNPVMAGKTMITGVENLLELSANVKRFVYISSSMVYGNFEGGIQEDVEVKPGSIYATYKYAGELLTKHFMGKYNSEYAIVRPSAVYGPRDVEDRVVSKFFVNAIKGNTLNVNGIDERLDFSYVEDVAKGMVLAAIEPKGANQTFNITYGQDETIHNAAKLVTELVGKGDIEICDKNPLMPSRGYLDVSKAKRLLKYKPKTNITKGFKLYHEWINKV